MARPSRRLILNLCAIAGALLLLIAAAIGVLVLFIDAETFRPRLERVAQEALGREVSLGHLRWDLGWRVGLASDGGSVANAPGFEGATLARWRRIEFGLALRPLLFHREARVDHLQVEGLELDLQRDAAGRVNWDFPPGGNSDEEAGSRFSVRHLSLEDARLRYRDAGAMQDFTATGISLESGLPPDLRATQLDFEDLRLALRVKELPLKLEAPLARIAPAGPVLELPGFSGRFDTAEFEGAVHYAGGTDTRADLQLKVSLPSLREQLERAGFPLPPMREAGAPGPVSLQVSGNWDGKVLALTNLQARVDETLLGGSAELPSLDPLSLRFELEADRVQLDRYLNPPEVRGKPFDLPVAWLHELDAKGTLHIGRAQALGAAARDMTVTVE